MATYSVLRNLRKQLIQKRYKFTLYAKGLTDQRRLRANDRGFSKTEARTILKGINTHLKALPSLPHGRAKKPTAFTSTKSIIQANKFLKSITGRRLGDQLKLTRSVRTSVITGTRSKPKIPQTDVTNKLKKIGNELSHLPRTRAGLSRRKTLLRQQRHLQGQRAGRTGASGGFIYKITEKKTGKSYIGQTIQTVQARVAAHLEGSKGNLRPISKFDRRLRKLGLDKFTVTTLARGRTRQQLDRLERKFITKFGTTNPRKGFNTVSGNYTKQVKRRITQLIGAIYTNKRRGNLKRVRSLKTALSKLRRSV